jgi:tetratricopeptide (TPR) repeat protein
MKEIISGALHETLRQIVADERASKPLLEKIMALHTQKTIAVQPEVIARMAFSLSNYKCAVDYWDMSSRRDEEKYKAAQTQLKTFPDNITSLFSAKDYSRIVDEYGKYEGEISGPDLSIVIQALFLENQHDKAFEEIAHIHSASQFEKIFQTCSACLDSKEKSTLSLCQRVLTIFGESWNKILKLVDSANNERINPFYIAMALARTDGLSMQMANVQKPISDFLEEEFIKKFENIPDSLVFDIGTAIEKAGKRIDALKYYEMAVKRFDENAEKKRICVERWILTKEMHAERSGSKDKLMREKEAMEKRKEYGIENKKIDDFIDLSEKSDVIKYIIDSEMKKGTEKPYKVTVKIRPENQIVDTDRGVKRKVEFDIEGCSLAYFPKERRLNITSATDGKTISLRHSDQKNDCVSTQDYVITDAFVDDIGGCQRVEGTPIYFCITDEKIKVHFENTNIVIDFL